MVVNTRMYVAGVCSIAFHYPSTTCTLLHANSAVLVLMYTHSTAIPRLLDDQSQNWYELLLSRRILS